MTTKRNLADDLRVQREYLFHRFSRAIKATRYGRGRVNSTWLVRKESWEIVVRFYPPFFKEKLETEAWVLRELNGYGGKVPRLLDIDTEGFSTPVLFMSKLPGIPLRDRKRALGAVSTKDLVGELRELLKFVATIPTSAYGYLHDPIIASDVADCARKASSRHLKTIKDNSLLPLEQIQVYERSFELLQNLLVGREVQLTYPDLNSGNILLCEDRFSGLVDWEFVMGFEPLYGFANLILELDSTDHRWASPTTILAVFPEPRQEELVLLTMFRGIELLSYLPTTVIFTRSEKKKWQYAYARTLRKLQKLLGC